MPAIFCITLVVRVLLLLLFAALTTVNAVVAQPAVTASTLSNSIPTIDIDNIPEIANFRVLRWRDTSGDARFEQLPPVDAWEISGSHRPAKNFGREWLWFRLVNSGEEQHSAIVSLDEVFPEEANFYVRNMRGDAEVIHNGLQIPIRDRLIKTRVPAADVVVPPGGYIDVFIEQRSRIEAILGLQVQAPAEFTEWVAYQTAGFMFFIGGAIAIIVFNLFLYVSIRDLLYLIYSVHACFVVLFVARYSGFTLFLIDTPAGHYHLATATWIQGLLLIEFTRRLLNSRQLAVWADHGLKLGLAFYAAVAVATWINIDYYSVGIRGSLLFTLFFLVVGIHSARRGNPLGIFYTAAQTPYLIGFFLLAGVSIGLLEYSFIARYGFIIGTFLELVTFSLALGYRFRMLQHEKFSTQADLLALQGSLNDQLQKQVVERTRELEEATDTLRAINSDYEALLQSVRVGVASVDNSGAVSYSNDTYAALSNAIPELTCVIRQRLEESVLPDAEELVISSPQSGESHVLLSGAKRVNRDGSQAGYWIVATDVTDMRRKEASINQASKMATLGEMSTGMAHELNQPLNVIRLTMLNIRRKLQQDLRDDATLMSKFDRIDDQVERAAKLISLMRTFGRVAPSAFEPFNVAESVNRAVDLMQEQIRLDEIELVVKKAFSSEPMVNGSSSQFEQVLINLMANARDAIVGQASARRRIVIGIDMRDNDCVVSVEDTGGGIADDVIDRVFEPFFTTKGVGEGTGLGGAISYGIIQDFGGTIRVRNTDLGARFDVRLPLFELVSA